MKQVRVKTIMTIGFVLAANSALAAGAIHADVSGSSSVQQQSSQDHLEVAHVDCGTLTNAQMTWTRKEMQMENLSIRDLLGKQCKRIAIIQNDGSVIAGGLLE